jgi:predicted NBD/HSP70 family sugar kinase
MFTAVAAGVTDRLDDPLGHVVVVRVVGVDLLLRLEDVLHQRQAVQLVKVGTGIGCGIVAGGQIHHGARGAAGDIGHIRATSEDVLCKWGNVGCLEAIAGGQALAQRLTAEGADAANSRDVVRLVRAGDATAMRMVREAGRSLGEVLAGTVNFFNPAVIVIGGDIAEAQAQLLAGVIGAAIMVIDRVLAPEAIDRSLQLTSAA